MGQIKRNRPPSHPGRAMKTMVIEPRHIQISELAESIGMSRKSISQVLNGNARLPPLVASKLARALSISATPWINMQAALDAYEAEKGLKGWKPLKMWSVEGFPG